MSENRRWGILQSPGSRSSLCRNMRRRSRWSCGADCPPSFLATSCRICRNSSCSFFPTGIGWGILEWKNYCWHLELLKEPKWTAVWCLPLNQLRMMSASTPLFSEISLISSSVSSFRLIFDTQSKFFLNLLKQTRQKIKCFFSRNIFHLLWSWSWRKVCSQPYA